MYDAGVDAVRHRHLGRWEAGFITFGQCLGLYWSVVAPTNLRLRACYRIHLSQVNTTFAALARFKMTWLDTHSWHSPIRVEIESIGVAGIF